MKAFVITLEGNKYSEQVAQRCINSAAQYGVTVEKYYGVNRTNAQETMEAEGLEWTWANNNTKAKTCPFTGLHQFPYKKANGELADLNSKIGCAMSHYLLWKRCAEIDEPILILEHDAVFLRPLPNIDFKGICQINDPAGATRKGAWWSQQMQKRGPGVFPKTWITTEKERHIPDGLAGNSAYLLKPQAAQEIINFVNKVGLWHNDAIINYQEFPWLQEYFPFITKVVQTQSTSAT